MARDYKNTIPKQKNINLFFVLLNVFLWFEILKRQTAEAAITSQSQIIQPLILTDFFIQSSDTIVSNLEISSIKKTPITQIDSRSIKKIPTKDRDEAFSLCDAALQEILKEHTWLPRGQLLKDLQENSLHVVLITPDLAYGSASMGSYSQLRQVIYIVYKPGLLKEDYKKTLLNELMTHLVIKTHQRCEISTFEKHEGIPFLKKDGLINQKLMRKFEQSIAEGVEQINKIKAIWIRRKEKLSPTENYLLVQFLAAAKHYTPQTFHTPLLELGGKSMLLQAIKQGIYRQEGEYMVPGPNFPKKILFSRGRIQGEYFVEHHTSNLKSAKGRAEGFLGDFDRMLTAINASEGPYAGQKKDVKLTEMGTFIAQYPKALLELIFPDFYAHMSQYLLQCSAKESKTSVRKMTQFFKSPLTYAEQALNKEKENSFDITYSA